MSSLICRVYIVVIWTNDSVYKICEHLTQISQHFWESPENEHVCFERIEEQCWNDTIQWLKWAIVTHVFVYGLLVHFAAMRRIFAFISNKTSDKQTPVILLLNKPYVSDPSDAHVLPQHHR
jgi:hypothetical protein